MKEETKITGTAAPEGAALGLNRYFKVGLIIAILALMWFLFGPTTDKPPRGAIFQVSVMEYYEEDGNTLSQFKTYYNIESIHEFKWGYTLLKDPDLGNVWIKTEHINGVILITGVYI